MADYRLGPTGLYTPGDLHADADTLHDQVLALDDALSAHGGRLSPTGIGFLQFENEWNQFYANNFGGFFQDLVTAANDGNRDQLIQFEQRFQTFASDLSQEGVSIPGGVIQTPAGDGGIFGGVKALAKKLEDDVGGAFKWIIIGAAVLIAGYVAFKLVNKQ